ncbi:MAG TPA: transglutaminaseTgpA domain-containing protein [Candidatus Limnocylindrales bacterium]|nr:transglutaminaseTgpA domain-containing protein [Candidatus Limnocylindrales bacterium]
MSGISTTKSPDHGKREWEPLVDRDELHDLPYTPREGWTSLIALVVMVVVVAVAVDDAGWAGTVLGSSGSQTGFLPLAGFLSVLLGSFLAKSSLTVWRAYVIGALVGAAYLLFSISSVISSDPAIEERLRALNLSVSTFVNEAFVLGIRSSETSIFLLIMGSLVWGLGLFAAFAVFRRHRPLPAILLAGALLLINVSVTIREQYAHLVVFVAAALVLLVRLNLLEQAREWRLRGMRDVADISGTFLRNGAVFVVVAILAATTLAANASSAPLSRAWNDVDDELLEIGYTINRWLGGVSGSARGPNILFTPTQTIRDVWQSSTEEVFTATTSDGDGYRWRGATYDYFDGRNWQPLDRFERVLNPGDSLLDGTPEEVAPGDAWEQVDATIMPTSFGGDVFVAPATPLSVNQPSVVLTHGPGGAFTSAELSFGIQQGVPYQVRSLVRKVVGSDALTGNQLASAGTSYPQWVDRYRQIRPGSVGDSVIRLGESLKNRLPSDERTPYHIAVAVQDYLYRTGGFTYNTDIRGKCAGELLVDCFIRIKEGFCEYFATTMVMLLRAADVPARYVLGYLPGREQANGSWRVDRSAAHAWVEVFFPGFGWVEFDPTPGNSENGQSPTNLRAGGPVSASGDGDGGFPGRGELEGEEGPSGPGEPTQPLPPIPAEVAPTESWLPIAVAVLVISGLAALGLFTAWQRRIPSAEPEVAYSGITRLATRLGHGPRPAQTAYEFAAGLGQLVPVAQSDLNMIATAKVEATYGQRRPGESMLQSLALAYRRVRIGLIRTIFRRPKLIKRPRGIRRRSS